jgi:hypothetical protein
VEVAVENFGIIAFRGCGGLCLGVGVCGEVLVSRMNVAAILSQGPEYVMAWQALNVEHSMEYFVILSVGHFVILTVGHFVNIVGLCKTWLTLLVELNICHRTIVYKSWKHT